MGLFEDASRPAKNDPDERDLAFSLPRPRPPPTRAQKKNHPQPTQNDPPIKLPHYQCDAPGIDPMVRPPSTNPVQRTPAKHSHPEPAIERALVTSRTRISTPLVIPRTNDRDVPPNQNVTYVIRESCPHHQGSDSTKRARASIPTPSAPRRVPTQWVRNYPITGPSPGANPPIYPSSLPLV